MPNAPGAPATLFKVFLFTDLVGSTEIKARIGDSAAAELIGQHDALFREALSRHHGTVQSDTGDGFFAVFERPTDALLFALTFVRDLSRIRQLENEVRLGETLAAAGRMAVGLAHEIRNPLGAIRGAVQLLARELGPDSKLQEYTAVLVTEVDRVNRIIEMLLDLARPAPIRPVPLNLHQLLERVTLLHEEAARERRVALVRRYDPSLPPILGDEDRLLQVFHNLVRNALEAMTQGGTLTLLTRVSLDPLFGKMDLGAGQRSMVEAQVIDEGGGIPGPARACIFDPFFTTKERGLGLGLAICHQVLEQHRGAIQVDSAEGRGTTVTCFLPIAR